MKKLFVVFFLGCMTVCSADASIWDTVTNALKKLGQNAANAVNTAVENSYTLSSGNSNSCYVLKSSIETIQSKVWYCGKHSGSACGSFSPKSEDSKIDFMEPLKYFEYGDNSYYCCDASVSQRGSFKIHPSSEKYPKEQTQTVDVGGGTCEQTVSIDACGKETKTPACDAPTECPQGSEVHNKKCVLKCPDGQHFKSATSNDCEPDEPEETPQSSSTGAGTISSETINGEVHIGGQNITGTPAELTYDFSSYDDDSCYVKKPKTGNGDAYIWYCGKEAVTKTCAHNAGNNFGSKYLEHNETFDYDGKTYRCCEGILSKRAGFFSTRTERTKLLETKDVPGGKCIREIEVDLCGTKGIVKDCNTPDPKLSVAGKIPVTKSNMQECGLCTVKADFKTCVINSCYERDADEKACTSKLKKACLIKK